MPSISTLVNVADPLVVTADVQTDQLLLRGMFGQAGKFSGGLDIPEGMMAVTVAVLEPADVAQYVRPGSQIAIFGIAENEAVPVGGLGAELGSARHRAAAEHCAGTKASPEGQQGPT